MITHRQMLSGMAYTAIASGAAASDISLQAIPQFHAGGNISQMAQILVGSTMVVPPRFDPELFLRLIEDEGVTSTCLVPSMLTFFLEHPRLNSRRVATMRRLMYGGSAIAPDRLSRALEIFSADFQQVYGQTEACVFATLMTGEDHRRALAETDTDRLLSCGRPMLGYEVSVAEATSPGAPGELLVRGDSVMAGYWRQPAATEKTLRNGWLHTGDLARLDSNGYVYIVDRTTDMIVSGGENVYPAEVENVISAHSGVLEVAVIGVPDDVWGESVKAIVALRPGKNFPEDELIAFCRGKIAGYKIPKSIDFADELPRTPSGKIKKAELRAKHWGEKTRKIN
jgi:acyl-CoA synthetase (AMP-forming)/AMP-acid ligase II